MSKAAEVLKSINTSFGERSAMNLTDGPLTIRTIPTGIPTLDRALGAGGLPRGRVTELFGMESSGKSTIALYLANSALLEKGTVLYIDAEHAIDPIWAELVGIDLTSSNFILSQPDSGEQALSIAELGVKENVDVIVIDSVAALVPEAEIAGDIGDAHMGLQARLMSQALRKITGSLKGSDSVLVFINQLREKIGVQFGDPTTTPGGKALKFYSSVRVQTRTSNGARIKAGDQFIGTEITATVVKNKVGVPFKKAQFDLMYEGGVAVEGNLLDMAEADGIIKRSGAWYYDHNGEKMAQGKQKAVAFLKENPSVMAEISELITI